MVTGTKGKAISRGNAGTVQKGVAKTGFQGVSSVKFTRPDADGLHPVSVSVDKRAGASSSSGHQSATKGAGDISAESVAGTELRRDNPGEFQ